VLSNLKFCTVLLLLPFLRTFSVTDSGVTLTSIKSDLDGALQCRLHLFLHSPIVPFPPRSFGCPWYFVESFRPPLSLCPLCSLPESPGLAAQLSAGTNRLGVWLSGLSSILLPLFLSDN